MLRAGLHHMCWNEICHTRKLEEVNDVCFCSEECYKSLHPTLSESMEIASPQHPVAASIEQANPLCVVCDEVDRGA